MRGRDCPAVPLGPAGKTFEPAPARRDRRDNRRGDRRDGGRGYRNDRGDRRDGGARRDGGDRNYNRREGGNR